MTFQVGRSNFRKEKIWTRERNELLIDMIGVRSYDRMAYHLNTTVEAVRKQAQRLGYRLDRGTITLRELSRQTGYDRHQFRRARKSLDQIWRRASGGRKLLISTEQADELVNFLKEESKRN